METKSNYLRVKRKAEHELLNAMNYFKSILLVQMTGTSAEKFEKTICEFSNRF